MATSVAVQSSPTLKSDPSTSVPNSKGGSDPSLSERSAVKGVCRIFNLPTGSVRASAFTLAKATLGAGALALPITTRNSGIVASVALLVIMALLTFQSISLVIGAVDRTNKNTYEEIVDILFGRQPWGYLFEVVMVLFCFGTCVTYLISVSDIIEPVIVKWLEGVPAGAWYAVLLSDRNYFTAMFTVTILLPLSLFDRINNMRYISFVGVICVLYLVGTTVYVLCRYGIADDVTFAGALLPAKSDNAWRNVIAAINTYTFAFTNQNNVPQIYEELYPRSFKRMVKVTVTAVSICFVPYVVMGLFGFLSFGSSTESSIIKNMAPLVTEKGDPIVALAFALMSFAVVAAFPLNVFPIRISIEHFIYAKWPHLRTVDDGKDGYGTQMGNRFIGTSIVVVAIALIFCVGIALPDVNIMLELVGSLTGSIICFFVPAAFHLRLDALARAKGNIEETGDAEGNTWRSTGKLWFVIGVGCFVFLLGTYVSVVNTVGYYENKYKTGDEL